MDKKLLISPVLVAVLLVSLISVSTVLAVPSITLTPSGGDDTAAIHSAIATIDDGGTIYFAPGTFHANIVIDNPGKSFALVGAGQHRTSINGDTGGSAEGDGSVIVIKNSTESVRIEHLTIMNGKTNDDGGGILIDGANASLYHCSIEGNEAHNGGGISNKDSDVQLYACTVASNMADNDGGGIHIVDSSTADIDKCTIRDNVVDRWQGGGIYTRESTVYLSHSFIINNRTENRNGAGMLNEKAYLEILNCVFSQNYSHDKGGAMMNTQNTSPLITNCTIAYNSARNVGGGVFNDSNSSPTITNCIIWGNGSEIVNDDPDCVPLVTYCDVMGGYGGTGNIDAHPAFVGAPFDLSLRPWSPCIDAGTDTNTCSYGFVDDDILSVPRPQYAAYDMGAYEFVYKATWSPVSIMPLMRTQLAAAHEAWSELSADLPEEPTDEMNVLVNKIQEHMQNATGLTNPVYASGELAKALKNMNSLSTLV